MVECSSTVKHFQRSVRVKKICFILTILLLEINRPRCGYGIGYIMNEIQKKLKLHLENFYVHVFHSDWVTLVEPAAVNKSIEKLLNHRPRTEGHKKKKLCSFYKHQQNSKCMTVNQQWTRIMCTSGLIYKLLPVWVDLQTSHHASVDVHHAKLKTSLMDGCRNSEQ